MAAIVVDAYPQKLGSLILDLRWAKDNPPSPQPTEEARAALEAFTQDPTETGDANRKAILKAAGVLGKIASDGDCSVVDIKGDEVGLLFDDEAGSQVVAGWKTVVVVPTRRDIECIWGINLFEAIYNKTVDPDRLSSLGAIIFKRCR